MILLLSLGQGVATPDALAALERANQCPAFFLARHAIGDWGELNASDIAENEYKHGEWISAAEQLPDRHWGKLWVITEADRSATTLQREMTNGHNVLKADFVRNPLRAHAFGPTLLSSQKRGHLAFFPFLNP
jgi:hypothetical protein